MIETLTIILAKGQAMTLSMTRTLYAKWFQIMSIANSCGIESIKALDSTPNDIYIKVTVVGSESSQKAFLEALETRFGFTQVFRSIK